MFLSCIRKDFNHMIAEYYSKPQKCGCYHSNIGYMRCRKYTYASCLEYQNNNGIIVKTPSQADAPLNIRDTSINAAHDESNNAYQPGHFDQKSLNKKDSFENGLLRYRKWWGKREAEVFVNGGIFTGIPTLTDKNTLRVDDGFHSYSIPLKKIECIRITDGLSYTISR